MLDERLAASPVASTDDAALVVEDRESLLTLFKEMATLLKRNNLQAQNHLKAIERLLSGSSMAGGLVEISRNVRQLKYRAALEQLRGLAGTQGWTLE
jgi:hypothetical protein